MNGNLIQLDTQLFRYINNIHNNFLDFLTEGISWITEFAFLWLLIILIIFIFSKKDKKRKVILLLLTLLTASGITNALKIFFARARPYLALEGVKTLGKLWANSSFPSGHTSCAVAALIILIYLFKIHKKWLIASFITFALFLGFARVYVGMHYPLDVFGGIIVGVISSLLIIWLDKKYKFWKV